MTGKGGMLKDGMAWVQQNESREVSEPHGAVGRSPDPGAKRRRNTACSWRTQGKHTGVGVLVHASPN